METNFFSCIGLNSAAFWHTDKLQLLVEWQFFHVLSVWDKEEDHTFSTDTSRHKKVNCKHVFALISERKAVGETEAHSRPFSSYMDKAASENHKDFIQ